MKTKGKMWSKVSGVLGAVGFLLAIVSPIIEAKAAPYEEEEAFKKLEERYGLTPVKEDN